MNERSETASREWSSRLAYWLGILPSRALGVVSCLMLFVMMVLTFVDVSGRYLFASPLPAAYEIISFIMPGIIFCALPFVSLRGGHVTIDLLDALIPKAWQRWQGLLVNLFAAAAMALIAWRLGVRAHDHFRFNEVTDELFLKLWPFSTVMSVLSVVATVALLVRAFGYLGSAPSGGSDSEGAPTT